MTILFILAFMWCTVNRKGQWQIYQLSINRGDQFLVNTVTGDVYQLYTDSYGEDWWKLMTKGELKRGE